MSDETSPSDDWELPDEPLSVTLLRMRNRVRARDQKYDESTHTKAAMESLARLLELEAVHVATYEEALTEGHTPEEIDEYSVRTWAEYALSQGQDLRDEDGNVTVDARDMVEGTFLNAIFEETMSRYQHHDRVVDRLEREVAALDLEEEF
jgi:hypothetical protein